MSFVNASDTAGQNLFSIGKCSYYQTTNKFKRTVRDENMIEIDPNYEQHIVEYHFMDTNRLAGKTTGRLSSNGPARPLSLRYRGNEESDE